MHRILSKVQWYLKYLALFADHKSLFAYRNLNQNNTSGEDICLRLRRAPEAPLVCRPGTTDAEVFWDVFFGRYHLPFKALSRHQVILDLGANVGFSAFDFATLYPSARVYAVEMDGLNAQSAQHNLQAHSDRCCVVQAAIWREDGEIRYDRRQDAWGFRADPSLVDHGSDVQAVRALTIETLMQEMEIDWVDYMKMDIEGAEYEVIRPDAPWLDAVGMLNLEIHEPGTYEHFAALLQVAGFVCHRSHTHAHALHAIRPTL